MAGAIPAHFERYRQVRAAELGCRVSDFESNALTVVARPAAAEEPFVAKVLTFGTGTVVSVEARYFEFVQGIAPEPHVRAFHPPLLLQPLVEHAAGDGRQLAWRGPNLSFLLAGPPREQAVPPGLTLVQVDAGWRDAHLEDGQLSNALGEPGSEYVASIWRYALALIDEAGSPAAVAGAYHDGDGLTEIGVDVARLYRGRGLGALVVSAMARNIVEAGGVPTYYCAPTNIRSQRTAMSCGFVPVASAARVSELPPLSAATPAGG